MENRDIRVINILRQNVVPAMGCTEPAAVALACAKAAQAGGQYPQKIIVSVDVNLMKNALAVGIPGVGEAGMPLAAALGALTGNPDKELMILEGVRPEDVNRAHRFVSEKRVEIKLVENRKGLLIEARVETTSGYAVARIEGSHNFFTLLEVNGGIIFKQSDYIEADKSFLKFLGGMDLPELVRIVERLPFDEIEFLLEGLAMNQKAAEIGLEQRPGLAYGASLLDLVSNREISSDIMSATRIYAAAAGDARMSGVPAPVMSSFGSGNHGIVIYLPIDAIAKKENHSPQRVARALALAHLIVGVTKYYTGLLTPHCGCAVAAGSGATVGAVYLMGGDIEKMDNGFRLILSNIFGMLCDGAKESCAQKVSTSASAVIECAYLAMKCDLKPKNLGIVGKNFRETLENLKVLTDEGMKDMDNSILKVLLKKDWS